MRSIIALLIAIGCLSSCNTKKNEPQWEPLFNGENLDNWIVKIKGYPAGENFGQTFRVEDGLLKVRYDAYDAFDERYGHIFFHKTYSHYKLRLEYRFVGEQVNEGPGWAFRNSGAMLHSQDPYTMHWDQDFPVSIEAQILGGNGTDERPTGNVCTPGTEIDLMGEHYSGHCANSTSKTYHGDQWVTIEMTVLGDSIVHHVIDGDTVMTYTNLIVAGGNVSPAPNVTPGPLKKGFISLQSESHPVDFRKVEIMDLSSRF